MSNSKLVNYTQLSPNCSKPRNHGIDKLTIHHMAGNLTVEQCGSVFASSSREASANYGIGTDGRVGLYVDEANRSWCSSNSANDNHAVTIEVANDEVGGNWHVSNTALAKLIDLCVDICQRNGIDRINYTGDKSGNLTMHKWFAATACPGPYLESKFPYIAEQVNARLENAQPSATDTTSGFESYRGRVVIPDLNIRKGPGTNYGTVGKYTGKGIFTIVEEASGTGATRWGLLKAYQVGRNGWISLDYAAKL
ncbi:amidase [Oscillospiraceae bacterium HV4-5-C5C]|nr:amidase [Oscillospiraceae bacterium HV4-5-C5C]